MITKKLIHSSKLLPLGSSKQPHSIELRLSEMTADLRQLVPSLDNLCVADLETVLCPKQDGLYVDFYLKESTQLSLRFQFGNARITNDQLFDYEVALVQKELALLDLNITHALNRVDHEDLRTLDRESMSIAQIRACMRRTKPTIIPESIKESTPRLSPYLSHGLTATLAVTICSLHSNHVILNVHKAVNELPEDLVFRPSMHLRQIHHKSATQHIHTFADLIQSQERCLVDVVIALDSVTGQPSFLEFKRFTNDTTPVANGHSTPTLF